MPNFIDADFDSALDLVRRWRAGSRLVRLGGFGRLGRKVASFFDDERLQRIFGFQAMYAGVAPYEALALYAVITYMDSIEGVFVPDGGMHAMATGLADAVVKGGAEIRYDADRHPHPARRRRRRWPASSSPAASASTPTSSSATPTCPWPTARCSAASTRPGPPAAAATRRRACCGWPACAALPPAGAAHHNIHFGAAVGRVVPGAHPRRRADARPVDPRHAALARRRRRWRPPGCSTLYALEPVPNLDGRVDWTQRRERGRRAPAAVRSPPPATRPTS